MPTEATMTYDFGMAKTARWREERTYADER